MQKQIVSYSWLEWKFSIISRIAEAFLERATETAKDEKATEGLGN